MALWLPGTLFGSVATWLYSSPAPSSLIGSMAPCLCLALWLPGTLFGSLDLLLPGSAAPWLLALLLHGSIDPWLLVWLPYSVAAQL